MQDDQYYIRQFLKTGSEEALYQLIKKYERQVFNLCYRIVRSREEAEEAAQDVFMKAVKELPKLEDAKKFPAWLMRIAYNRAIDYVRKSRLAVQELDEQGWQQIEDTAVQTPLDVVASEDRKLAIEGVISSLPPLENGLISLFYLEGLSVKEVAEITQLTESNVKVKLHRTRELLRKLLERKLGNELKNLL